MPDDKRKKKLDARRVSLTQRYERKYVRRTVGRLYEAFRYEKTFFTPQYVLPARALRRVLRATIKLLDYYEKHNK